MLLYNTEWRYDHGMAVNYSNKKCLWQWHLIRNFGVVVEAKGVEHDCIEVVDVAWNSLAKFSFWEPEPKRKATGLGWIHNIFFSL